MPGGVQALVTQAQVDVFKESYVLIQQKENEDNGDLQQEEDPVKQHPRYHPLWHQE